MRGRRHAENFGDAAVAASIFLAFAPMQISDGVQSAMPGALRGLSDTAWPAAVSAIAYWAVSLPWRFHRKTHLLAQTPSD